MKKVIIIVVFSIFCFSFSVAGLFAAQQIGQYGYEDWDGSAETTPGYPWGSNYNEYWKTNSNSHINTTEIVSSYASNTGGIWTAHSGTFFHLANNSSSYSLSPSINGITTGTVNNNIYLGLSNPKYGGLATDDWNFDKITTGEFFLRFWARHNKGFSTITDGGRCKWVVVGTDDNGIFWHLGTHHGENPPMYFYNQDEGNWLGTSVVLNNAYDGNWHKYSLYINFNTGTIRAWYDVENETAENATKSWTEKKKKIGNSTKARHLHIEGNFSAKSPSEQTYHALDDIEIWDGLPVSTSQPLIVDDFKED